MAVPLPQELVFMEILTRLPVKSLLKFRCVSKSWNSFLSSPSFIAAQLSRTQTTNNSRVFYHKDYHYCSYDDINGPGVITAKLSRTQTTNISRVFYHRDYYNSSNDDNIPGCMFKNKTFVVAGYCNGVICLMTTEICFKDDLVLWNPSIRKSLRLPEPIFSGQRYGPHPAIIGFGFDSRNNDYKVVRIVVDPVNYKGNVDRLPIQVEIYSLNSGSWKIAHDFFKPNWISILYGDHDHAFVNDAVHWQALHEVSGNNKVFVLSYDLSNELFKEIMLPECLARSRRSLISVFNKCLEVFQFNVNFVHIWVMKEYGVVESWTKGWVIDLEGRIPFFMALKQLSCDPQSREICNLEILGEERADFYCGADLYLESLVLLS